MTTLPAPSTAPWILNVNDDESALAAVTRMLTRARFNVVEARSGTEALAQALQRPPDVVILDVDLHGIDGVEVCRRLRSHPATSGVKILHTAAMSTTAVSRVSGLDAGADGYLSEPFEAAELIATVRSLLRLASTEAELRDRATELLETDRRKDEFLAMLAHELRNPLAAITAALALLDAVMPSPGQEQTLQVLTRQIRRLTSLVDDLLDVSRVTQGRIVLRRERLDLASVVRDAMAVCEASNDARLHHRYVTRVPAAPVYVSADLTRLEQVLANLLDNARKYTPSGGCIDVSLSVEATSGGEAEARVRVRDTGIGIAPEHLPGIFDLFAQGPVSPERSRGGLGIGLTLVRSLVELHGGRVSARSDGVGRGTEFEFALVASPRLERSSHRDPLTPMHTPDHPARRLLIIEDNADARLALATLCRQWGHDVLMAADGQEGLTAALEGRPDVTIIDLGLPGIDGLEVARQLRADPRGAGLYLVALTGYGSAEHRRRTAQAGFNLHLVKPVSPERLAQLLATTGPEGADRDTSAVPAR